MTEFVPDVSNRCLERHAKCGGASFIRLGDLFQETLRVFSGFGPQQGTVERVYEILIHPFGGNFVVESIPVSDDPVLGFL